jgi:conjugal transfer/entry exclusion protein
MHQGNFDRIQNFVNQNINLLMNNDKFPKIIWMLLEIFLIKTQAIILQSCSNENFDCINIKMVYSYF